MSIRSAIRTRRAGRTVSINEAYAAMLMARWALMSADGNSQDKLHNVARVCAFAAGEDWNAAQDRISLMREGMAELEIVD